MSNNPIFNTHRVQHAFSASAKRYDQHAQLQQDILDECIKLAKPHWNKGSAILDVGTGTGALATHAADQQWQITGLDISTAMCRIARTHGVRAVAAGADALPFADESFDGVFSSLMLQWSNDPLLVFKELIRVLKPGGRCVLSTFTHGTLEELRQSFAAIDSALHVNEFGPPNYYSALAVHAGFRVLSSEETIITEYHPNVMSLMHGLKAIGATTKQQGTHHKGLMTPRQFKQLEQTYRQRYSEKNELPATWQVMIALLERP